MTFWNGKKVLITGHTGFKGSWLALWLQSLDAEVIGYALPPATTPNLFSLAAVDEGMKSVIADVRNVDKLKQVVSDHQPEIIFHMAAQPLVRYSYENPIETYATNVMGSVHLFEAAKAAGSVKAIVNITTDKCYENKEWCWGYREEDRLGGYDPYSNSKACAELVSSAFRDSYFREMGIGLATARAGNVIGGGDWAVDRLIPDIIHACMEQESVLIRHPNALRPWQHVLEPLNGYMQLAEHLYTSPADYSESWNFGPNDNDIKPVSWIADCITEQWGGKSRWVKDTGDHPHEATYLKLDCSKVKNRLGWQPHFNLQQGLEQTVAWYKAHMAGQDMKDFTLAQIEEFVGLNINRMREQSNVETAID